MHAGSLSDRVLKYLDKLDNIVPAERDDGDFVVDPFSTSRTIRVRDHNLGNLFTPVELEFYNRVCKSRLSNAEGDNWLKLFK